jgi:HPr kinase/phosphorylase
MKEPLKVNHELVVHRFFEMTRKLLKLKPIAGESGFDVRKIADRAVNRPALALTGYFKHFAQKRLNIPVSANYPIFSISIERIN